MPVRPKVLVAVAIVAVAAGVLLASAALRSPAEPPQIAPVLPTPRTRSELTLLDQDSRRSPLTTAASSTWPDMPAAHATPP
jgi:hypothetical protein